MSIYREYKQLNQPEIEKEILKFWKENKIFERSVSEREGAEPFVFYEGPPSANGMPGIHHVMARAIKDIFCRYHTLKGSQVKRKAGWDTHGLPIELAVEKALGITKEDIGKSISIEDYNKECRREVMQYKDKWEELTEIMGYWVDMEHPYVTYENKYIETLWWLLKLLYNKGLLYKGYTIQPYSPAAGTGLSTHELNQPGTYKPVKDTTAVAMFKLIPDSKFQVSNSGGNIYFLAWTTTPWTLPSNTALAVGKNIDYVLVDTFNQYTSLPIKVILAKALLGKYFPEKNAELKFEDYKTGDKNIPFKILAEFKGADLAGLRYEQLLPFEANKKVLPIGEDLGGADAFKVLVGDFVSTEDGTGIVHLAPSFGSDDFRTAKQNGVGSLTLVDKRGRFVDGVGEFSGEYVKEQYLSEEEKEKERIRLGLDKYLSVDERIAIKMRKENKAFKTEKYEHSYPHCWRTDKPVLYYPLDSWFIKTTALKERMVELNNTINWKPESTGTGRFGNWLENLQDWNLSRSRFWGTPLPIWRTEDGSEEKCIGSIEELYNEIEKSVAKGFMKKNPIPHSTERLAKDNFDLHRPYCDDIFLVSDSGKQMKREADLIDVWFDSGAMPYAQWHFPFEQGGLTPGPSPKERGADDDVIRKSANPKYYEYLKAFAKENRKNQTRAEEVLWDNLRDRDLVDYKFRRQHIVDVYIADFINIEKKLIIEVDGLIHSLPDNKDSDEIRTERLKELGFEVIRFTNDEILKDTLNVLKKIKQKLDSLSSSLPGASHPHLPRRGGGEAQISEQETKLTPQNSLPFPANFIAEGVDQTRGWFFTLHAIATMCFDSVAYKNVVSNGLVLDKNGNKMSKRLGNAVDPFETIGKHGADATRWYMIANAAPWDNLKFDAEGIVEVKRKLFGTLYNTYGFFALYANVDKFLFDEGNITPVAQRSEMDRWIISKLQTLIEEVHECYDNYEPHRAARAIEIFVDENLSNWYIRLSRRRFWKSEMNEDKKAAYETLYECLRVTAQLMSPIAPFFSDWLYRNLSEPVKAKANSTQPGHLSVHLTYLTKAVKQNQDKGLEERMSLAQKISSLALSLRKKANIKVRQPLNRILIPVLSEDIKNKIELVKDLVLSEINVKNIEYISEDAGIIKKKVKANFKLLGARLGKKMKAAADQIAAMDAKAISELERAGSITFDIDNEQIEVNLSDVEIQSEELEGWSVASENGITVALDIHVSPELEEEGNARELVNRIQRLRKEKDFNVTDRISVTLESKDFIIPAINNYKNYICAEILADRFDLAEQLNNAEFIDVNDFNLKIIIQKT